jgi:DNA-binding Xre family transcriptional regulator
MVVVRSRLKVLVAEKEIREKRRLSLRTISRESGASLSTVVRLDNNSIKQVPLDDLARLCAWVPCQVGELLRLEEEPDAEPADVPNA